MMAKLQAPFRADEIEWRVGSTNTDKSKGLALAYITNRAIQDRLDNVFGCFGWKNEYKEWKDKSQLCGISVKVGDEWITKWDGSDDSNTEATKGGLSDAMKRAAYQWGIGRYLYKLPSIWCEIKPQGKSFVLKEKPKLPAWALPVQCKSEPTTEPTTTTTEETPKEKTIVEKLADLLMKMSDGTKEGASKLLEQYTTFTNKEGKVIKGKNTFTGMSEAQIRTTYGKVKADHESKLKEAV